jgi:hypothetical protein
MRSEPQLFMSNPPGTRPAQQGFGEKLKSGKSDAAASVGTVEIVGWPQVLHTRTFGGLDVLFVPLLDIAREMLTFVGRMTAAGETRAQSVAMGGIRMATEMLKDPSFTLATRTMDEENKYVIDLDKGTLSAGARLYAVVRHRTSMFKVVIEGKIVEGPYVVRNVVDGSAIVRVDELQMRQSGYFSTFLPEECLRAHLARETASLIDERTAADGEVRITVSVNGENVPFILKRKDAGGTWDIVDGRMNQWIGVLPSIAHGHLNQLMQGLALIVTGGRTPA